MTSPHTTFTCKRTHFLTHGQGKRQFVPLISWVERSTVTRTMDWLLRRRPFCTQLLMQIAGAKINGGIVRTLSIWRAELFGLRATTPAFTAFPDALRALGWIDGQNILLENRFADNRLERL